MSRTTSGFTIVELLIVVVVIAILAAVSVVAYTGIQDRAISSAVKSDLANFSKKIELVKVDTADGLYPATITAGMGMKATKSAYQTVGRSNWYYCVSPDRMNYSFGVVDVKDRGYYLSSVAGIQENAVVNGSVVCTMIGSPAYTDMSPPGYYWSYTTNTGSWYPWVN